MHPDLRGKLALVPDRLHRPFGQLEAFVEIRHRRANGRAVDVDERWQILKRIVRPSTRLRRARRERTGSRKRHGRSLPPKPTARVGFRTQTPRAQRRVHGPNGGVVAPADVAQSLENLKLERDAIVLYDSLASIEKDDHRAAAFRKIAGNERRHAEIWADKLR